MTHVPPLHFAVLAVDVALFAFVQGELWILLIPVHLPPSISHGRGLPGGLIHPEETAEQAIQRIVRDKTGIELSSAIWLEQLQAFTRVDRDPRGRVVSLAHIGVLPPALFDPAALKNGAQWSLVRGIKALAYDHKEIMDVAEERLRAKMAYTAIARFLLPKTFTLSDLQSCYEQLLGQPLDRRNFRKRIVTLGVLEETGKYVHGSHRPAMLYRFARKVSQVVPMLVG